MGRHGGGENRRKKTGPVIGATWIKDREKTDG